MINFLIFAIRISFFIIICAFLYVGLKSLYNPATYQYVIRKEPAVVWKTQYTPSSSSYNTGVGISTSAKPVVVSTLVTECESYTVVLKTKKGLEPIQSKKLFGLLKEGDSVIVLFKDKYYKLNDKNSELIESKVDTFFKFNNIGAK